MRCVTLLPNLSVEAKGCRSAIEDEIERLLALLDRLDGDPDAEPDGTDEPLLGWTLTMAHGNGRDLEANEVAA